MRRSPNPSPALIVARRALPALLIGVATALASSCSSSDDDEPTLTAGSGGVAANAGTGGSAAGGAAGGSAAGGAGAPAGGSAGAPAGGAGGGGGPVAAACPEAALFCDDFEEAAVGAVAAPWSASVNQATVNVDEAQAYSGTKAVHVNAPQAGTYHRGYVALNQDSGIFPSVAQEMYGRAMMYLPVLPNADVHWTFIQGEGRAADDTHNALYRYGGQHMNGAQLMANYETTMPVATDCWNHSATLLPVAAWTCVEWRFSATTNEMQFWMNGTELTDLHVTDQGQGCGGHDLDDQWLAPPAFQTLYLGWEHYQQTANPIDLWMDDVAVGTERLGCPPAP